MRDPESETPVGLMLHAMTAQSSPPTEISLKREREEVIKSIFDCGLI